MACLISQKIDRDCKRLAATVGLLAYAAVFCLSISVDGWAFEGRASAAGRPNAARPFAHNSVRNAGPDEAGIAGAAQRPLDRGAESQNPVARGSGPQDETAMRANLGRPSQAENGEAGLGRTLGGMFGRPAAFRNGGSPPVLTGKGLRHRPFPGVAGFTGNPPPGETRFVSNEMVFHAPPNVSAQAVDAAARRLGLVAVSSQNSTLSGGTLFHFRIDNGRQVSDVVRELEAQNIGVAQPNYIYRLQ
jgi:hypothetical protein